ncbi:MAG: Methyltransferase type 12 [Candidatus Nomurabacteria bacterium GW2011_GWB1_37_5]|uniref:Methyltransferase type 12 n=1 Tax=Candidatus Nomurabacteria bacterium GW2011_GWB1_37_5 TaxID=1618742 RepID=A0A0G0K1N1_9BACT|nr:MAG: Methyltransferase type 12 [Candidatus Nomurabacteria bacterium GW2011_GWB1_37_5]
MTLINFIKTLSKDHKVAAIFPSTPFAAKKFASEVKPHYKIVVEYGAGDGAVTKEILKKLPKDGKLFAVELNLDFVNELKKINDDRLHILSTDVAKISKELETLGEIDMVISGIPFTFFKPDIREEVIRDSYKALRPNGSILLYQHYLLMLPYLKRVCGKKNVRWYVEPRNFLPYWVMIGEK